MAKKKSNGGGDVPMMTGAIAFKPPTQAQIIKSESRYLGQRVAESHPKVKKIRDEISRAVEGAVKKALRGATKIEG